MNRPVMELADGHPAKKFLTAFIGCRLNCVGRHHDWAGQPPVDQQWRSSTDGKNWSFSEFAYKALSFDIELDGFLQSAPCFTESETHAVRTIPLLRTLMQECGAAAERDGNREIIELTDQVLRMLGLWEQFLEYRKESIAQSARSG